MSEQTLWQEVLLRAVMDARLDPDADPIPKNAIHDTAKARDYLTTPSKDLATVCSCAGVDMDALIDRMRRRVADLPALDQVKAKQTRNRGALYEHAGRSLTVKQWAEITGISAGVIHDRLHRGMSVADALTTPLRSSPRAA